MKIIYSLLISLNLLACDQSSNNLLDKIPDIENYSYYELSDWASVKNRSAIFKNWIEDDGTLSYIPSIVSCIIKVDEEVIWICDPNQGQIVALTNDGEFHKIVLNHGKGPSESLTPVSIFEKNKDFNTYYYVYDYSQKTIIKLDNTGSEQARFLSKNLPNNGHESLIVPTDRNTFYWNSLQFENFTLAEWDSAGDLKKGIVPRLIPMGYQPITHNDVTFDYSNINNQLVFAYSSLPLIFLKNELEPEERILINLAGETDLRKLDINLDLKPIDEQISVNKRVKNVYLKEKIIVAYQNEILVIPYKLGGSAVSLNPIDEDGQAISFHIMKITKDHIYLINHFRSKVYRISISEVIN